MVIRNHSQRGSDLSGLTEVLYLTPLEGDLSRVAWSFQSHHYKSYEIQNVNIQVIMMFFARMFSKVIKFVEKC